MTFLAILPVQAIVPETGMTESRWLELVTVREKFNDAGYAGHYWTEAEFIQS